MLFSYVYMLFSYVYGEIQLCTGYLGKRPNYHVKYREYVMFCKYGVYLSMNAIQFGRVLNRICNPLNPGRFAYIQQLH